MRDETMIFLKEDFCGIRKNVIILPTGLTSTATTPATRTARIEAPR